MDLINKAVKAALTVCVLALCSCNKNIVFSEYQTFKNNEWHSSQKAVFDVEITDTLSLNNVSLMIRHADGYPYRNVFLFVTSAYPDGAVKRDTMEVILSGKTGEWLGKGLGDIFDYKVPIKQNVRFPLGGKYTFTFEHAMEKDPLPLIMDFGFEIEKVTRED